MLLRYIVFAILLAMGSGMAVEAQKNSPPLPQAADQVRPLLVGRHLPAAQLTTLEATTVDLSARLNGKSAVLIFYRGGW